MVDTTAPTSTTALVAQGTPNPTSPPVDFYSPLAGGGSMLNSLLDSAGPGDAGEPLNVIISGLSSPEVLTDGGFLNFARAIGYDREFLGMHRGTPQSANLGDGNGWVNEHVELRQSYPIFGTGLETLIGGKHFRVYRQNGPSANSGALFLSSSKEADLTKHHTIVPDGYNINRDAIASAAIGKTSYKGVTYFTRVRDVMGLLEPGVKGVNHNISQDGIVVLLTVKIVP